MTENDPNDLFTWAEKQDKMIGSNVLAGSAEIAAFPLHRDVGRVRQVAAAVLKRRSEQAQQAEFDRAIKALGDKLAKAVDDDAVRQQLEAFTRAVNNELYRQQMTQQRPGGAA